MGNSFRSVLLFFCLLVFAVSAAGAEKERILATVNGAPVTFSDYRRFMLKIDPSMKTDRVDDAILKKAIEETLILQEATRQGIRVSDKEVEGSIRDFLKENKLTAKEFERKISAQGMKPSDYRRWLKENIIVLVKMIGKEVNDKTAVNEGEIKDYYERNKEWYRAGEETIQVKAILLRLGDNPSPAEATYLEIRAMKVEDALRAGEPFEKLAGLYSEDPSKKSDGAWGEFRKGDLVPAIEKKLLQLKEGEVSGPLWSKEGLYIFKLAKRQGERFAPFESVKEDIRRKLLQQKRHERYSEWVNSLWKKANIEILVK
ncbi:MAG: SurA N-terminal domain-containing protein [Nitrospiraceae bacterium]|nr:SurA N-terminal domain-containing protein [Nitrospiraceae bacterium]MDA8433638.1 SurA N-terminal domain-containing protein [Nitrospiraceae bacterium]